MSAKKIAQHIVKLAFSAFFVNGCGRLIKDVSTQRQKLVD